jgi:hypothetical protein
MSRRKKINVKQPFPATSQPALESKSLRKSAEILVSPFFDKYVTRIAILFLGIHFLLAMWSANEQAPTYDEVAHLPAGYTYWKANDFRLNPEHPPLVKLLAALPMLFMSLPGDPLPWADHRDPSQAPLGVQHALSQWVMASSGSSNSLQFQFGNAFLYALRDQSLKDSSGKLLSPLELSTTTPLQQEDYFHDVDRIMFWCRLPPLFLSLCCGLVVFYWSREIFGAAGGVLSLALYCWDPSFLAHGPLVTTDVGLSLFFVGTLYFLSRTSKSITGGNVLGLCLCCGAAAVTKYSAFLLLPIAVVLGLIRIFNTNPWPVGRGVVSKSSSRWLWTLGLGLLVTGWTVISIWACYGFRYNMIASSSFPSPTAAVLWESAFSRETAKLNSATWTRAQVEEARNAAELSLLESLTMLAQGYHLLPEAYLHGFAVMQKFSHQRGAFLRGKTSLTGSRAYFPWAFLLKTPLLTLACIGVGIVAAFLLTGEHRSHLAYLLVPVVIYASVSIASKLNIGHRHLLPIYPFLFICAGAIPKLMASLRFNFTHGTPTVSLRQQQTGLMILMGLGWLLSQVSFASPLQPDLVYPNYLAYGNEFAGGPRRMHESLVDSNCDWGQGVKQLGRWLREQDTPQPIEFSYFGTADPQYYGIRYVNAGESYHFRLGKGTEEPTSISAISVTHQRGGYLQTKLPGQTDPSRTHLIGDAILLFER